MMLTTVACEPASWFAMLPQKFWVATTVSVPEDAVVAFPQALASDRIAPTAVRAIKVDLLVAATAEAYQLRMSHAQLHCVCGVQ
jgi:hypothetical protein